MFSGLTLKMVSKATGAPFYTVKYLNSLGRLPVVKESQGPGYPTIFHEDAIKIVQEHLEKSGKYSSADVDSSKPVE